MTCRRARAVQCAVGFGLFVVHSEVWAEEAPAGSAETLADSKAKTRGESVRVDLGIGLMGGGFAQGASGLGALGSGGFLPTSSVTLELRLGGPTWLVVSGSGGYRSSQWEQDDTSTSSTASVALHAGPRFEWPIVDRVAAGFHVLARGAVTHAESAPSATWDGVDLGGVAGGSIHFRATPVFGVRLVLDAVGAGYGAASTDDPAMSSSAGYAQLMPSTSVELTFTF